MSWYSFKGNDVHKVNNIISGGRIMKEKSTIFRFSVTIRFPYEIDSNGDKIPKDYMFDFVYDFGILDTNQLKKTYRIDWGDSTKNIVGSIPLKHRYVSTRMANNLYKTFTVKIVSDILPVLRNKVTSSNNEAEIVFGMVVNEGDFLFSKHKFEYKGV